MNDGPTSADLLDCVARTLSEQVMAETAGATRHSVRIAASLCRIVARELRSDDGADIDSAIAEALAAGANGPVQGGDLAMLLDERLQSDDPEFESQIAELLYADVCRRVDIVKPRYRRP